MSRRTVDIFDRITQIKKKKNCFKYQETDFDKQQTMLDATQYSMHTLSTATI